MLTSALLLLTTAIARDNPFFPLSEPTIRTDSGAIAPPQLEDELLTLPPSARILKSVSLTHQSVDGSIGIVERKVEKQIDWHSPVRVDQPNAAKLPRQMGVFIPVEGLEEFSSVRFFVAAEVLKLQTQDEMIRHFFLPRPSRVVMDFNSSIPFNPISNKLEGQFFTSILLDFHENFYRVTVTLDSFYPYTIEAVQDGFLLGLN
ncbi:AMIN domain-containing protein [Campylobacterota bacterium]|nr:AMIN domain-containing protein [Campylobacterota bacterium]